MEKVQFKDLGLIDYKKAWDYQEQLFKANVDLKLEARRNNTEPATTQHHLLFCEHPHVYTLGKSGKKEHLLITDDFLAQINATYYKINRGGDITYHGPGQLVAYPILDLDFFFNDIHKYLRYLEEAVILTLAEYGLKGTRSSGETGVWLDTDTPQARKICAMGVKCSRWVTMHGIGFNINTDMSYFNHIVPCGIQNKAVTSLQQELGQAVEMTEVKDKLKSHLSKLFDFQLV